MSIIFKFYLFKYLKSIKHIVILLKEIIVNIIIDFNILDNIITSIYLWVFEGNF